jgi:hypothetical protein
MAAAAAYLNTLEREITYISIINILPHLRCSLENIWSRPEKGFMRHHICVHHIIYPGEFHYAKESFSHISWIKAVTILTIIQS